MKLIYMEGMCGTYNVTTLFENNVTCVSTPLCLHLVYNV